MYRRGLLEGRRRIGVSQPKPLKVLLPEFARIEDQVTEIIAAAFGVDFSDYVAIKKADLVALATEKRDLMPYSVESWDYLDGVLPLPEKINPVGPVEAKARFLGEFQRIVMRCESHQAVC